MWIAHLAPYSSQGIIRKRHFERIHPKYYHKNGQVPETWFVSCQSIYMTSLHMVREVGHFPLLWFSTSDANENTASINNCIAFNWNDDLEDFKSQEKTPRPRWATRLGLDWSPFVCISTESRVPKCPKAHFFGAFRICFHLPSTSETRRNT